MSTKSQHSTGYRRLTVLLKSMREEAELTQRGIGKKLRKPQSYVYNCETGNRRVDVSEFVAWAKACGVDPMNAFGRFLND
jgi:hypothetical protein